MPSTRWLRTRKTVGVAVVGVALVLFGCEAVLGLGDLNDRNDTDASTDSPPDVGTPEVSADAPLDAAVFTSITDLANWDVCDLTETTPEAKKGFTGGTFDGRYVYLAPRSNQLLRLDTTIPNFCSAAALKAFPLKETNEDGGQQVVSGYAGSIYDGSRYAYFVPSVSPNGGLAHVALRYDTQADAGDPKAWLGFDTSAHFGHLARGFVGSVFDGHYIYFVPNGYTVPGPDPSGLVVRYDVTAPGGFQDASSWTSVDLVALLSFEAPTQFAGGLYLAPYVYFIPERTQPPYVTRYDTTMPLDVATSWATYDITTGGGYGFAGGAVVGADLYLAPSLNAQGPYPAAFGTVLKHDTAKGGAEGFTNSGSWQKFDVMKAFPGIRPAGFYGAATDGRWVYFAPEYRSVADAGPDGSTLTLPSAKLARFDTTATFAVAGSWQVFDIATVNVRATSFAGAIFDGTYVYFPPSGAGGTLLARFRARAVGATPPFTPSFL